MTRRRVVALAQALTMIMLLLPGPDPAGPALVRAALEPAEVDAVNIFDAAGKGIGCQAGTRKYKGPGLPKDPPWPPGAEPTPSPVPIAGSEATLGPDASSGPDPSATATQAPDGSDEPAAAVRTAYVAADLRPVQAEPPAAQVASTGFLSGIDVSHHNGDIDYARVVDAGHRFVFIKATQDIDFLDPMFPTNLARARAAGLAVGAYHFFDYTLDGRSQADHFLDRLQTAGALDDALPPVVDVECWKPIGASIHAVSATRLRDFVDRVYERTGRLPIVYTSVYMWREVVGNAEGFEDLPLWAACWGCEAPPSLAPGWDEWAFWQTGLTRIPTVGRLDGNYFGGSETDLEDLRLRPFAIEGGAVATSRDVVELDLGGRDATHIRTSPDGETWSPWRRIRSAASVGIPSDEGEHTVHAQLRHGTGMRSPVVSDSIVVDRTPPQVTTPAVSLREGAISAEAGVPVTVSWQASDAVAGLADAAVMTECGPADSRRSEAPGSAGPGELATWEAAAGLVLDATCQVTVISQDGAGNAARATLPGLTGSLVPLQNGSVSAEVTGDQVGVIARRGPEAGRAAVLVDGVAVGLVDLHAPGAGEPEIVFVADLAAGPHRIELEPTGSEVPASSGDPAWSAVTAAIDGFVSLAR